MVALDVLKNIYDVIRPILDIGILAFVLYKTYMVLYKTNGMQLVTAAIVLGVSYAIATFLQLPVLTWLLNILAPSLIIGFAIVFQPELRKIFLKLGQTQWFSFGNRSKHTYVDAVLIAAETLSNLKRGMLAVFVRHSELKDIVETGQSLDAKLSSNLLVTIFAHDTPMHDGAAIIKDGKVLAAGCFLPISEQYDIRKTFGSRHRAALGLSEVTDAVVLIVSEETGSISLAYDSRLHYDLSMEQLTKTLESLLDIKPEAVSQEDSVNDNQAVLGKM